MQLSPEEARRRFFSALWGSAWLLLALVGVFCLVAWFASFSHGVVGVYAAATAGLVCLLPSVVALLCVALTAGTPNSIGGTLLSMVLRTALPFFAAVVLLEVHPALAEAGLFGMVLVNYLVALAIESVAAVCLVSSLNPSSV